MRLSNTILKPLVTEKTFALEATGVYVFEVNMEATKASVAKELKRLFNVDATDVNVSILPGKPKRVIGTRKMIKTEKRKKAVVKLKEGQKIELFPKD